MTQKNTTYSLNSVTFITEELFYLLWNNLFCLTHGRLFNIRKHWYNHRKDMTGGTINTLKPQMMYGITTTLYVIVQKKQDITSLI